MVRRAEQTRRSKTSSVAEFQRRRALATTTQAQRRDYRPRRRKRCTASSRRNQATRAGWLGAQGAGEAIERFAVTVETLQRRCELAGDEQGRREKQRTRKEERRRLQSFIGRPRKQGEAMEESFPRQREAKSGHSRAWNAEESRRRCSKSGEHCSTKLQNYHLFSKPNYSQFCVTTQKSPKTKFVQNSKFYNFAFIAIPKFSLHFEMQI